jgi:hypothetical protein
MRQKPLGQYKNSAAEQSKLIITTTAVAAVAHIAVCIFTRLRCVGRARLRTATPYTNVLQSDAGPVIFQNHGTRADCSHFISPLKSSNKHQLISSEKLIGLT